MGFKLLKLFSVSAKTKSANFDLVHKEGRGEKLTETRKCKEITEMIFSLLSKIGNKSSRRHDGLRRNVSSSRFGLRSWLKIGIHFLTFKVTFIDLSDFK